MHPVGGFEPARETNLDDTLAKGSSVRDDVDVAGANVRRSVVVVDDGLVDGSKPQLEVGVGRATGLQLTNGLNQQGAFLVELGTLLFQFPLDPRLLTEACPVFALLLFLFLLFHQPVGRQLDLLDPEAVIGVADVHRQHAAELGDRRSRGLQPVLGGVHVAQLEGADAVLRLGVVSTQHELGEVVARLATLGEGVVEGEEVGFLDGMTISDESCGPRLDVLQPGISSVAFALGREQFDATFLEVRMFLSLLSVLGGNPVALRRPLSVQLLELRASLLLCLPELLLLAEEAGQRRRLDVHGWLGDRRRPRRLEVPVREGRVDRSNLQPCEIDVVVQVEGKGEQSVDLAVLQGEILVEFVDLGLTHLDVRGLGFALEALPLGFVRSRHRGIRPLLLGPRAYRLRSRLRLRSGGRLHEPAPVVVGAASLQEVRVDMPCFVPSLIGRISLY